MNTISIPTEATIKQLILSNDQALLRALVVIYENQTSDEQATQHTRHRNGKGFNQADANKLTYYAKLYLRTGWLSEGKKNLLRQRLPKYAGQLHEAAVLKAEAKARQEFSQSITQPEKDCYSAYYSDTVSFSDAAYCVPLSLTQFVYGLREGSFDQAFWMTQTLLEGIGHTNKHLAC